jgi:hypothetical protein
MFSQIASYETFRMGEKPRDFRKLKSQRPISRSGCTLVSGSLSTLFAISFLVVGISVSLGDVQHARQLKKQGQTAAAVITKLQTVSEESGLYSVHYRFNAPVKGDPMLFEGTGEVHWSQNEILLAGQPISIVFLPSDPQISMVIPIEVGIDWVCLMISISSGSLVLFFSVPIFIKGIQSARLNRHLQSQGLITQGVVLDRWENTQNNSSAFVIAYTFEVHLPRLGYPWISHAEINRAAYEVLQRGDLLRVRYMPQDPEICQLIDFPG